MKKTSKQDLSLLFQCKGENLRKCFTVMFDNLKSGICDLEGISIAGKFGREIIQKKKIISL